MYNSLKIAKNHNQPELFNKGEIETGWKSFSGGLLEIRTAKSISDIGEKTIHLTKAVKYFSETIRYMPDYELAHGYLGEALFFLGKYKLAYERLSLAIELCGIHKYPAFYFFRGCSLLKLGKIKSAVNDFNKTIDISPEYLEAYYHRGIAYHKANKYNNAIYDFLRVIDICLKSNAHGVQIDNSIYPDNLKVLEYLASSYFNIERFEDAAVYYTRLIENNYNLSESYFKRGLCFYNMNLTDESLNDFSKVIELDEYNHESYYYRANIYAIKEEYKKAINDYDKSISLYLNNTNALIKRAAVFMQIGEYSKSLQDLNLAKEISPDFAVIYYNLGVIFQRMDMSEKSIENFRTAAKLGHRKASLWLKNHKISVI